MNAPEQRATDIAVFCDLLGRAGIPFELSRNETSCTVSFEETDLDKTGMWFVFNLDGSLRSVGAFE